MRSLQDESGRPAHERKDHLRESLSPGGRYATRVPGGVGGIAAAEPGVTTWLLARSRSKLRSSPVRLSGRRRRAARSHWSYGLPIHPGVSLCVEEAPMFVPSPATVIVKGARPDAWGGTSCSPNNGPCSGPGFTKMAHPGSGGRPNVTSTVMPGGTVPGVVVPTTAPIGCSSLATTRMAGRLLVFSTVMTMCRKPGFRIGSSEAHAPRRTTTAKTARKWQAGRLTTRDRSLRPWLNEDVRPGRS
jgi:hypothetical protein